MGSILKVHKITNIKDFEGLESIWNELLEKCSDKTIFLTWDWLYTWWGFYGFDRNLCILLIKDEEEVIGIAPLMQYEINLIYRKYVVIENVCAENVDYSGFILAKRKSDIVLAIFNYLIAAYKNDMLLIKLSQIPEKSSLLLELRKLTPTLPKYISMIEKPITSCPYASLPDTKEEYFSTLTPKRRHNLSRSKKLLLKEHKVRFDTLDCETDEFPKKLKIFFNLNQKRWEKENLPGNFADLNSQCFLLSLTERILKKGWCILSFFIIEDEVGSAVLAFKYNDTLYYYGTAYNIYYSKYSLGHLHIMHLIEDSIRKNISIFDFLKGDENYKYLWAHDQKVNYQIIISRSKIFCKSYYLLYQIFIPLRAIRRRGFNECWNLYLLKKNKRNQSRK